jgi:hypothetical protein
MHLQLFRDHSQCSTRISHEYFWAKIIVNPFATQKAIYLFDLFSDDIVDRAAYKNLVEITADCRTQAEMALGYQFPVIRGLIGLVSFI